MNRTGFKNLSKVCGKEVTDWDLGQLVTRVTGGDLGQSEGPKEVIAEVTWAKHGGM